MQIVTGIDRARKIIESAISKNGHMAQHNFSLFKNYNCRGEQNVYFDFGESGILAYENENYWRFLTDPIAPENAKATLVEQAASAVFLQEKAKKIILEDFSEQLKKDILKRKNELWHPAKAAYFLFWPKLDILNFDASLAGGSWKRIRNIRNKFYKENKVEIKKAVDFCASDLNDLILGWKKKRNDNDRVHLAQYTRFVESGFEGLQNVRVTTVNGLPAALVGGWPIPNSSDYYSFFGICDYDFKNISVISYLDELAVLKEAGFKHVELGGSYGGLLDFKNKFQPSSIYRTYTFSLIKNNEN
ncbi:MAG: hypothetical protein PHQ47_02045 [Candidatus Portnoybacteria bacterium]|nr:hypothetical protein [Candidatus Portnoybacteria bacterium]